MKQRLTQAKLRRYQLALSALINAVHEVRKIRRDPVVKPGRLVGTSRFVKSLLSLSHATDYSMFEAQLKRRLVRAQHLLRGRNVDGELRWQYALGPKLSVYADVLERYEAQASDLLKTLAEVDIRANHQQQQSVQQLLASR